MTGKSIYKGLAALTMSVVMVGASANSVTFDQAVYDGSAAQIFVTVNYDFTEFPMHGGGVNLEYNTDVLQFWDYEQAPLPADAGAGPVSPVGGFEYPGLYAGFGIGSYDLFNGMGGAGPIGTFVFNVVGTADPGTSDTECGEVLCLLANPFNPMTSIAGFYLSDEFFPQGAHVQPIPVPAAVWFLLSGVGVLFGMRRRA